MMEKKSYYDYIYEVDGENIIPNPQKLFQTPNVYLFIDKQLKVIWIWAGTRSRLFHRYIGANWAGKLKSKKEFHQFKYEVIKQDREPRSFLTIMGEIESEGGASIYQYPGESRHKGAIEQPVTQTPSDESIYPMPKPTIDQDQLDEVRALLAEVKEMHSHIKYSMRHIEKRIEQIENLTKKF